MYWYYCIHCFWFFSPQPDPGVKDTYLHHCHANRFEFRFQGESLCCIFIPSTFEKNDIVTNNATSSHLNDNFVFSSVYRKQQQTKVVHLNDKREPLLCPNTGRAEAPFRFVQFKSRVFHQFWLDKRAGDSGCVCYCTSMHHRRDKWLWARWLWRVNSQSCLWSTQPNSTQLFLTYHSSSSSHDKTV